MVTESNMNAEELKRSLFQEDDINIFDVFAILYSYCKPRFNKIRRALEDAETKQQVEKDLIKLQERVLPSDRVALSPLDDSSRRSLVSELEHSNNLNLLNLKCFTILQGIDKSYDKIKARSRNIANFPSVPKHLNRNDNLGLVYPKLLSPISLALAPTNRSRTGKQASRDLRDYLDNLTYLKPSPGYDIDFIMIDSAIWLCFPEIRHCKIAVIPLIDQINSLRKELRDSSNRNERLIRYKGVVNPDQMADRATAILQRLSEKQVTLVIFPELCIAEEVRHVIADGLRKNLFPSVKMIVAGSFHECDPQEGDWYNISHVLGPDGNQLWQQRKLQPFTLMSHEASKIPSLSELADKDTTEDIVADKKIVIGDMPLGRMVVLICSDFVYCDSYREILHDLNVNFIVVPAMTSSIIADFTQEAKKFATYTQATTVVSNSCAQIREKVDSPDKKLDVSFAFLPVPPPQLRFFSCENIPKGECSQYQCTNNWIIKIGDWPNGFTKYKLRIV